MCLVPGSEASQEDDLIAVPSCCLDHVACLTESALPFDADIGRDLTFEFVSKPKAGIDRVQARASFALGNVLRRQVRLDARLQDESLRQQKFILSLDACSEIALFAEKG